jgi:Mn-dependent DtxR family transcriptional regulator
VDTSGYQANRLKLSPVSDNDLKTLTNLGLVEMQDYVPVLTQAGYDALD